MSDTEHLVKHLPNDIGGAGCHEKISITERPLYPWEKRCHALLDVLDYHKIVNTEEKRRGTENLGTEMAGKLTYYEKWIVSASNCLLQKGILTPDQIADKTKEVSERFNIKM
ncbi:nitrile hydratase subunit beta [Ferruginibacter paludis]|uniref:SH3-like domain-containing protein n=1 Tax=Ferruginibacter paludis TaxID=1310417 RepID=UPI0025B31EEF|nr:SH3-like domain-containing protein [Ferruginibacter paludis]MDN3656111.1 nitrile hydratase subunit beta [Ferruginibacter paludis]